MGALFFQQAEHGRSLVFRIVCDSVSSQDDTGRVVLFVPFLNLKNMNEFPLTGPSILHKSTMPHVTESRRKLGSWGFAL